MKRVSLIGIASFFSLLFACATALAIFFVFGSTLHPTEAAATRTWTGGGADNNWTTAANWGGIAPVAGDDLIFNATGVGVRPLPNNNFAAGTSFGTITVSASGYTIGGNSVSLTSGLTADTYASGTSTVSLVVGGAGSVTMNAGGTLVLSGVNTFTGGLTIKSGIVQANTSNKALGGATGTGTVTIGDTSGSASATLRIGTTGLIYANPIVLATGTTGTLTIGNTGTAISTTFSGGVTGTNNLTINANATTGTITFSTVSINNSGTITNVGAGTGTVTISGGVGTNVTAVIQNSTTSALTISGALTVNSGGTTLTNSAGTKILTVSGGVIGTGNLVLNNNSTLYHGIILSTNAVNNVGTVTNSGTGTGSVLISASIGTNVTNVIQASGTSLLINTSTVYVNASWLGTTSGADPDGAGPALDFGFDSFATVQGGATGVSSRGLVNVSAGLYQEDVSLAKTLTLQGAGIGVTTISGPIGGGTSTISAAAAGVVIDGFSITRNGNNVTDWNNAGLNGIGIGVIGQANDVEIRNVHLYGNRNAIDINNSDDNWIHNNIINDNRTGILFRNKTDNTRVIENEISDNWTLGILFIDGSSPLGSNVPVQSALNSTFTNNEIAGNWYGGVVDRQSGGSIPAPGTTNLKNFSGNWWGVTSPVTSTASSTEPSYSTQIPVAYGGTATPPGGQPDILGVASANIDYTPFLMSGTDTNGMVNGFQGNFGALMAHTLLAQVGATGRLAEAISRVTSGGTVSVLVGTYPEALDISVENVTVKLAGNVIIDSLKDTAVITFVDLQSFTLTMGNATGTQYDGVVSGSGGLVKQGSSTTILTGNNTYTGLTTVNAGTLLVDGSQGASDVSLNGGTLGGTGTVGAITSTVTGGTVSPGGSTGILNSGSVDWSAGPTTFSVEMNGIVAGTNYDQLNVTGTVDVTGATLSAMIGFSPIPGNAFTIINNDSTDAVTGTFSGLPEGTVFTISTFPIRISYTGGTNNNDVVLTMVGVPDATQSTLTPTSASITADGIDTQVLTVTVKYEDGSNVGTGGDTVTITKQSGTGTIGSVTDNGDGTYTATVTSPTLVGSGVFVATFNGQPVKNGTIDQTEATVTYTAGPANAAQSTLTPTSASITADGSSTQILTVTAKDVNDNLLTTGGAAVSITRQSGTGTIGSVTDNADGTYTATVTSSALVGSGVFVATLGGQPVKSGTATQTETTVTYFVGVVNAAQSTLTPTSASMRANGTNIQILTVTAKDASGNDVGAGGPTVTITKQSGTGTIGPVTDHGDGTYSASVTAPTSAGSGTFVATLGGQPVKSGTASQTVATVTYTAVSGGGGGGRPSPFPLVPPPIPVPVVPQDPILYVLPFVQVPTAASDAAAGITRDAYGRRIAPLANTVGISPITLLPELLSEIRYGELIRSFDVPTVYLVTKDRTIRPFWNATTYFTWANSFDSIVWVTNATLSSVSVAEPMLAKPRVVLVKISSDPRVYDVQFEAETGAYRLRWIAAQIVASTMFGNQWDDYVIDVDPLLFIRYTSGPDLLTPEPADLTIMKTRDEIMLLENPDIDGDGLSASLEALYGTNPFSADTDNDGYPDSLEVSTGHDPLH